MSEEQPFESLGLPPVAPEPEGALPPEPERYPFWGYSELALFAGMLIASAVAAMTLVSLGLSVLHVQVQSKVAVALAVQSLIYAMAFAALALLFRVQYQRPFWRSLGWTGFRVPPLLVVICGVLTAFGVAAVSVLLRTPTTSNRITEMLADPKAMVPVAIFGLTLAPLAEELAFRGFLQPLLVRSLGPVPGVLAAAIPFGLLHFQEYGNSWRHALLISLAGAAFGWMRHHTGSTMASTLMHASYNALEFFAFFTQQKDSAHL
jgi:membrane protease YdiL (CAAX protease family)